MSAEAFRKLLGSLQEDPENEAAWDQLEERSMNGEIGEYAAQARTWLEAARRAYIERGEAEARADRPHGHLHGERRRGHQHVRVGDGAGQRRARPLEHLRGRHAPRDIAEHLGGEPADEDDGGKHSSCSLTVRCRCTPHANALHNRPNREIPSDRGIFQACRRSKLLHCSTF